ncbi:hypothetical protein HZB74_01485 [Candidatus Saccharibacteria bacterium]|nr:hypothetical protein [Candidatus Saccharibacteria bacterium]
MTHYKNFGRSLKAIPEFEFTPQETVANRMFGARRDVATPDDFNFFHGHIRGWNTAKDIGQNTPKTLFEKVARRTSLDARLVVVAARVCAAEGLKIELGPVVARVGIEGVEVSPKHLARVAMVDFGLDPSVSEAERFERMATIIGNVEDKSKILGKK